MATFTMEIEPDLSPSVNQTNPTLSVEPDLAPTKTFTKTGSVEVDLAASKTFLKTLVIEPDLSLSLLKVNFVFMPVKVHIDMRRI